MVVARRLVRDPERRALGVIAGQGSRQGDPRFIWRITFLGSGCGTSPMASALHLTGETAPVSSSTSASARGFVWAPISATIHRELFGQLPVSDLDGLARVYAAGRGVRSTSRPAGLKASPDPDGSDWAPRPPGAHADRVEDTSIELVDEVAKRPSLRWKRPSRPSMSPFGTLGGRRRGPRGRCTCTGWRWRLPLLVPRPRQ